MYEETIGMAAGKGLQMGVEGAWRGWDGGGRGGCCWEPREPPEGFSISCLEFSHAIGMTPEILRGKLSLGT